MIENGKAHLLNQLIKEHWLYNPTPNYWITGYYTDLYMFSSMLKNSVNSILGFQPFIKQHSN